MVDDRCLQENVSLEHLKTSLRVAMETSDLIDAPMPLTAVALQECNRKHAMELLEDNDDD